MRLEVSNAELTDLVSLRDGEVCDGVQLNIVASDDIAKDEVVCTSTTRDAVYTSTGVDGVIASAGNDGVVSSATEDGVNAFAAIDGVCSSTTEEGVGTAATDDGVSTRTTSHAVSALVAVEPQSTSACAQDGDDVGFRSTTNGACSCALDVDLVSTNLTVDEGCCTENDAIGGKADGVNFGSTNDGCGSTNSSTVTRGSAEDIFAFATAKV